MGIIEPINQKQIYFCTICNGAGSTRHHLVPKSIRMIHKDISQCKTVVRTCRKCHDDIHYYFSHWELALKFNNQENLINELKRRKERTNNV